jgi:Fe-S-cluster containining protein
MIYQDKLNRAKSRQKENKDFLKKLSGQNPKALDRQFQVNHAEVFENIDCLSCANCCKTTSPIFLMSDIKRLAKALKISVKDFMVRYLTMDEDDDFVLTRAPCPFLASDNTCKVYDHRPKACREYPHTDRKNMAQILDLTFHNTLVCPAVSDIVDRLINFTK